LPWTELGELPHLPDLLVDGKVSVDLYEESPTYSWTSGRSLLYWWTNVKTVNVRFSEVGDLTALSAQ